MLLKTKVTHVHRLTVKIVHEICVKSNGQNSHKSVKLKMGCTCRRKNYIAVCIPVVTVDEREGPWITVAAATRPLGPDLLWMLLQG